MVAVSLVLGALALQLMALVAELTLVEWLVWLTTQAAWGVVSSKLVQVIKKRWPTVVDELALGVSMVAAVLVGVIAQRLIPWASGLNPMVQALLVWLGSQLWYALERWLNGPAPSLWVEPVDEY